MRQRVRRGQPDPREQGLRKIEIDCTWPAVPTKVVRLVDQERETIARIARRLMQSGGLDQQLLLDLFIDPPPVVGSP